jgi:hypothetical protein
MIPGPGMELPGKIMLCHLLPLVVLEPQCSIPVEVQLFSMEGEEKDEKPCRILGSGMEINGESFKRGGHIIVTIIKWYMLDITIK